MKLLGAMQQVVELGVAALHDLGAKAAFYGERRAKAITQGEQAAKLGLGDAKALAAQLATAEKNFSVSDERHVYEWGGGARGRGEWGGAAPSLRLPLKLCM